MVGAILDALRPLGITHIDMPATPNKIWHALQSASAAKAAARPYEAGGHARLRAGAAVTANRELRVVRRPGFTRDGALDDKIGHCFTAAGMVSYQPH